MPLRLEIKKKLTSRSERVKSVEIHPTEPWVLSALYSGNVFLWDYEAGTLVKSFEVCPLPVRCAKFITRKQMFITASDDMMLRVYNYNTMEKVHEWEAHTDYIRYLEVHPSLPHVLSCSDDTSVKLWDWDHGWECMQEFDGHGHYVMMVKFNLKDTNTFASASLDRTIRVWGLGSNQHHFILEGHDKGVNCIDYYPGGDKPYLLSGADDRTVKIWDYQTKACVQTLEGHTNNVSAVLFHARLPVLLSGSEDGTVRIWHATTYRHETTLNYGMERVWTLAAATDSNELAIGFDEGTICLKLGQDKPVASLDVNTGKLVWAINTEIQTCSLKGLVDDDASSGVQGDGERMVISGKDLGNTELFPQVLRHNCNGRFLVVCGDGEYIIYTSQALRNKSFGSAIEFVWSSVGTGDYAISESISRVKIFRNFKEAHTLVPPVSSCEGLFGGACLGVKGSSEVVFFDWEEGIMVRKIDVVPTGVYWSDNGDLVLVACDDVYYVLKYDAAIVHTAIAAGQVDSEEGVESAFDLRHEIQGVVKTGQWVGDCFLYTNEAGRLNYYVGGEVMTLSHLDHEMYMLGYLPKEERVYLMDKGQNVYSYRVRQTLLQYQTAVVRKDFDAANALLPAIPKSEYANVARFLESQGFKEEALQVSTDPDHKFDLALELEHMDLARDLLVAMPEEDKGTMGAQMKWKRLGDLALVKSDLALVEKCALHSDDLAGLLLLHSSSGNIAGMLELARKAVSMGKNNVAFVALFICGKLEECLQLLLDTGRIPEAAFLARTYLPSEMSRLVELWKEDLAKVSVKAAEALADPAKYPNLFTDLDVALKVEVLFKSQRGKPIPANQWPKAKGDLELDLIELIKQQGGGGPPPPPPPPQPIEPDGTEHQQPQPPPPPPAQPKVDGEREQKKAVASAAAGGMTASAGAEPHAAAKADDAAVEEARKAAAAAELHAAAAAKKASEEAAAAKKKQAEQEAAKAAAEAKVKAEAKSKAEAEVKARAAAAAAKAKADAAAAAAKAHEEAEATAKMQKEEEAKAKAKAAAENARRAAEAEAKRRAEAARAKAMEEAKRRAAEARAEAEAAAAAEAARAAEVARAAAAAPAPAAPSTRGGGAGGGASASSEADKILAEGGVDLDDAGDLDDDDFGDDW